MLPRPAPIFSACFQEAQASMRYHIDTIPVWDALKQQGECPLCALRRSIEAADVDRFLGGSVMEPDTRVRVNEKGFCQRHHVLLYAQPESPGSRADDAHPSKGNGRQGA